MLKEMVDKIKESGANVVMFQKGIDDLAQHYLAKEGIILIRRVKKSDMSNIARATGGTTVSKVDDLTSEDLGNAGTVYEEKIAGSEMAMVEDCKNPKSVSVLIRGGTEHVVDELERSLEDSLKVVKNAIKDGKIFPGGVTSEIELSLELQNYAKEV